MKQIIAILSLIALALNAVASGVGVSVFCKHDDGEMHRVSSDIHDEKSHIDCCHHDNLTQSDNVGTTHDCNSCVDVELDPEEIDKAQGSTSRNQFQDTVTQVVAILEQDNFSPANEIISRSHLYSRGPPVSTYSVAVHIESTVLRV